MLLQKNIKSFKLFNKDFRPGLLLDGDYCIAVKCKIFSNMYNHIEENYLHVSSDKSLHTRKCFLKNITDEYPTRVCTYTERGYIDIGWGLPIKIDSDGKYVLDVSEEVQKRFKKFDYPSYPGKINLKSNWTMFDEWIYESTLEAKYAKFFTCLNIDFVPQPAVLPSMTTDWWRIDFLLWEEKKEQTCYVEIKPGRPYEEEEMKCEIAAQYTHPIPIVLFYGEMTPPFVFDNSKERPNGVTGIRWKKNEHGSITRDYVFFRFENGNIVIDQRKSSFDMSWSHPDLIKAYHESNFCKEFTIVESCCNN